MSRVGTLPTPLADQAAFLELIQQGVEKSLFRLEVGLNPTSTLVANSTCGHLAGI
jgi:hypothetical protein